MVEELFERELGAPLGINAVGAAEAVVRIANTKWLVQSEWYRSL